MRHGAAACCSDVTRVHRDLILWWASLCARGWLMCEMYAYVVVCVCVDVCVVEALLPTAVHSVSLAAVKGKKKNSHTSEHIFTEADCRFFTHQTESFQINLPIWLPDNRASFIIHHQQIKSAPYSGLLQHFQRLHYGWQAWYKKTAVSTLQIDYGKLGCKTWHMPHLRRQPPLNSTLCFAHIGTQKCWNVFIFSNQTVTLI